jgi:dinuclear metal center YbgI/SA1388 family protein
MSTATVADLVAALEAAYPPSLAESWDSVGLVCGDPHAPVARVLFAVDATAEVVAEALDWDADALVVHHPLLLRGVDSVAVNRPKGALVHRLIRGDCALFTAHTNADSAAPGVSDALAAALGLTVTGPLAPRPDQPSVGLGRIGILAIPQTLAAFTARVAAALPATAWGVRAAGDPDRHIETVAVCGGAGDSLLATAAAAGVDAYLTADLRHHPADEQLRAGGPALLDAAHWATEFPWCAQAESVVRGALPDATTRISARRTDPWTLHSGTVGR